MINVKQSNGVIRTNRLRYSDRIYFAGLSCGLRQYVSPRISALWRALESRQLVIGPLILLAVATLVVGPIVSALRVVVLEPIFHFTGVRPEKLNYHKLTESDHLELFKQMIKNVYRYEQFYGNMLLALLFCTFLGYLVGGAPVWRTTADLMIFVAIVGALITHFLAGRKSLTDVYRYMSERKSRARGD